MRFGYVLLSSVLFMGVALGSALLSLRHSEDAHETQLAAAIAGRFSQEAQNVERSLRALCKSPSSGLWGELHAADQAAPSAEASWKARLGRLSSELERPLWLLSERDGRLALLAASAPKPLRLPSLPALRAATERLTAVAGEEALTLRSCSVDQTGRRIWLASVLDVGAWTRDVDGARLAITRGSARGRGTLVAQLDGVEPEARLSLWLSPDGGAGDTGSLKLLLSLSAGSLLLGFAVAMLRQRRDRAEDQAVFDALDEAARRVALGDLGSQIGLRVGGRADQTFRSFDNMTRELRETRAKLRDAERAAAWQDMARRIAHELKNPLFPMQTAMETLQKAHAKQLPDYDEIVQESTRAVLEEVRRLERIVREFSEFARLPKPRPGSLDLVALVRDVMARYAHANVRAELHSGHESLLVNADREQLTQVLINLINNAQEACLSQRAPALHVHLSASAEAATLHVDDNGPGIAKEDRERVLEPYVTTKPGGTGLGLAIARRIAIDHGGELVVSESPLGGARLTLRLPGASALEC